MKARWAAAAAAACELCGGGAAVHCEADAAFLCWPCDARVHGANFLVARHLRRVACAECRSLDDDRFLTGAGSPACPPARSLCCACCPARSDLSSDSESASCVSTAESAAAAPSGPRGTRARRARGGGGAAAMPSSRARLAAALWSAARRRAWRRWRRGGGTAEAPTLRSLEAASGMPAKLVVRASPRLARAAMRARAMAMEEGWAECC